MPIVSIPGAGNVQFPDTMSAGDIQAAIEKEILPKLAAPAPQAAPEPEAPGMAQGLTQAFGRGASFGLSDRLAAAASDFLGRFQDAGEFGNYGGTYSDNLKSIQADRDKFAEQHPVADFVANAAGGVASSVPAVKALAAAPQLQGAVKAFNAMSRPAQYATAGGAFGAFSGAGNAPEDEMLRGAGIGGAAGAVLGTALPYAIKGGAKVADVLVGAPARAIVNAFRTPEDQGLRRLALALSRDNVTADALGQKLQELGPNAVVADAAGKNTLGLADLAVTRPGIAKDAGMQMLDDRAKGAGARVVGALKNALGVDSTNFDALTQQLHGNMRDVAERMGYDNILNSGGVELSPRLEKMMQAPIMKDALASARTITKNDIGLGRADSTVEQFFKELPSGEVVLEPQLIDGRMVLKPAASPTLWTPKGVLQEPTETVGDVATRPTLRVWDYVKRGLDSIVRDETDPITGKMTSRGETAAAYRRNLLQHLDDQNPAYAEVRGAYADEKSGENALNLGRSFMRDDSEVTARRLADMTPAEQQYFKAGAARAVQDMIGNRPDTGMAYADFLKRPNYMQKLSAAFGNDQAGLEAFMGQLRNEATMGTTHASVGKNSLTAGRTAAAQDEGAPITAGAIPMSKREALVSALRYLTKPSEEVSAQLNDSLLSQDPAKQRAVIAALRRLDESMARPIFNIQPGNALLIDALLQKQLAPGLVPQKSNQ